MDDRDRRKVGEQIESGGRQKAPDSLELLQRLVNTWNYDFPAGWDRLGTPEKTRSWLLDNGLVTAETKVSIREAASLRDLSGGSSRVRCGKPRKRSGSAAVGPVREASRRATLFVNVDSSGRTVLGPARVECWQRSRPSSASFTSAGERRLVALQGLPAMPLRFLRPLEEPIGRVARGVDLREPDEEPRAYRHQRSNAGRPGPG
jgi:hypothetical protein